MSTGKRLAKRSIIGTRVCAPGDDGKYYSGVIHAVKTPATFPENNNCINLTPNTRYSVRFDTKHAVGKRLCREFRESELIGPGFGTVTAIHLPQGQKVFLTFNGRETSGEVINHDQNLDEVKILIPPLSLECQSMELVKRLDEVRLLESRKSARLMDQDTDFARLADMSCGERKRQASHTIDVPHVHQGSRKRRPSSSQDDFCGSRDDDLMDECSAALVLMSLSCSPHSPKFAGGTWGGRSPPSDSSDSWCSGTPSPPLSDDGPITGSYQYWMQGQQPALPGPVAPPAATMSSSASDEGIVQDYQDELPKKKKASRVVFQCTWRGCSAITTTCSAIENHIRSQHLGPKQSNNDTDISDHEEEFYFNEVELSHHTSSPPTLSHQDMARPPHEDPEYQRRLVGNIRMGLLAQNQATPITIPSLPSNSNNIHRLPFNPSLKHNRLSPRPTSTFPYPSPSSPPALLSLSAPTRVLPSSPSRRMRGENKKCRKVYGMEHRELWCTQCKWKKACSRFGD